MASPGTRPKVPGGNRPECPRVERSPSSPVRLLIVDDDESMLLVCRRFFQKSPPPRGIEITEAESGERAVELLSERGFDCVLCDYRMGAVTGVDVLAYAATTRPDAVRILMTGFESDALRTKASGAAGVHEVFEKPTTHRELEALLRERVLERWLAGIPPART